MRDKLKSIINGWANLAIDGNKEVAEKRAKICAKCPHNVSNMAESSICYSNNSTFVATTLAFQKGFRKFDIYGVDIEGHKNLDTEINCYKMINDWRKLITYLESNNCEVNLFCKLKDLI